MEHVVFPRQFLVTAAKAGDTDTMAIVIQDVGGDTVRIVFGLADWPGFQAFVADHEAAARSAEARAQILRALPPDPTKPRKH